MNGQSRETGNIGYTRHTRKTKKPPPKKPQHNANLCYFQFCIKHLTCCLNYMNIFNV